KLAISGREGPMVAVWDRLVWWGLLVLPAVMRLSEALPAQWLPGEYANTTSDALRFISDYNSTAEEVFSFVVSANWNFNTNLTDHNSKLQVNASLGLEAFSEAWGLKGKTVFTPEIIDSLPDPKDQTLIRGIMMLGFANLPEDEREENSKRSWPNPGATRSCCSSGRPGTMSLEFL
uniref:Uncharacterized protein n=1 Tax=Oryzias latipes TaxID=8090 RepID=A0A3P9JNL8_ORYLA